MILGNTGKCLGACYRCEGRDDKDRGDHIVRGLANEAKGELRDVE